MFKVARDSLLSLLYPQECRVCFRHVENADDGVACARCWSETRLFDGRQALCARCGAYFKDAGFRAEVFCRNCDAHRYDGAAAAGVYEKALAAAVIHLKTNPVLAARAADAFIAAFDRSGFGSTVIIPVPLSRRRQLERGYNQADILGKLLSQNARIKLDRQSLARRTDTAMHRVAMDMKARELSVRNAFDVTRPRLIEGQSVLLVDDVLTSGSTASYCAKALKKCGAAEVNVLTLARAV
jgi:ComF family protein